MSDDLRASDADRELAAADLRAHYAAGRITADELSDRLEAVYAARTAGDLAGLGTDLPPLSPARRPPDPELGVRRRRLYQDAGGVVIASVACVAFWLAAGAHGQFWPIWIILIGVLRLMRDGWRLLGPGAGLEGEPAAGPGGRGRADRERRHRHRRSW